MTSPRDDHDVLLRQVDQLLDELEDADPPPGLVERVIAQVKPVKVLIPVRRSYGGGLTMAKKAMLGVAAAAVVVLAVLSITGFPKITHGTEATITAARKAETPQIAAKDVVLGDTAVQQFMQSDVFDRLVKDPAARRILSNPGYRGALAEANVRGAMLSNELKTAMADSGIHTALLSKEVEAAFSDKSFVEALDDASFRAWLARGDLTARLRELEAQLRRRPGAGEEGTA